MFVPVPSRLRHRTLALARYLGLEPPLRTVQLALSRPSFRRNVRDEENLRLLMAATLTPTSNYVDVGANIGDTLVHALAYAPQGHHIAVEPLPELCDELRRRHRTVDVHNLALSNAQGETEFTRVCDAEALSGFLRPDLGTSFKTERLTVRTARLDDVLPAGYVPRFVKIDVEGAEVQVLEGAFETLRRHKPIVAFEHGHGAALYGKSSADVYALLSDGAGLAIFDMDGNGPFDSDQFRRTAAPEGPRWNFFARCLE